MPAQHPGWSLFAALACQTFAPAQEPEQIFEGARWLTVAQPAHPLERAEWIWVAVADQPEPTCAAAAIGTVALRVDLHLDEPVSADAVFWIAADNRARVRVNDVAVGESTSWSEPSALSVTQALRPGRNRIELVATNDAGQAGSTNPAGVLAALELILPDGSRQTPRLDWESPDGVVVRLGPADSAPWTFRAPEGPCPIFRQEFTVDGPVRSARIAIVGLGHYQLRVNGQAAGDTVIGQAWSQYDRRIYYQEIDVTAHLRQGHNALGVLLGNGFWKVAAPPPGRWTKGDAMPDYSDGQAWLLRARVEVVYQDGRAQTVVTGPDWKVASGPLTLSHIFAGEDFDARLWPVGWDRPGFDDSAWHAAPIAEPPAGTLARQDFPGLRAHEVFEPVEIRQVEPDRWSYLFAQNCSALLRFGVRGPAGATVEFKPSEVITEDGVVEQLNLHGREALFRYTLRGGGAEVHQCLFHYHGGQYVQVRGAVPVGQPNPRGLPVVESLELVHVRAANPDTGRFACSDELYERTHDLVDWAMRSNMSYVLSDCPHREKLGWLECSHLLARSFLYRFDCAPWLAKIVRDIADAQLPSGRILTVAPHYLMRDDDDAYAWTVEWGAAGVLLPWQLYRWSGDLDLLRESFPTMQRFVDHVDSVSRDGIAPGSLGDWYDYGHGKPPGPSRFTPTDLTATACQAMCIEAVAESARLLGMPEEQERYDALLARVRAAFLDEFYDPDSRTFRNHGSPQTAHAMALCAGLVPEADRDAVFAAILADLEQRDWQQTPGDVGHLFFIRALADAGRSDVLHRVYSRTSKGSYGGILAKGLTTMPETWDAITVGSNSLNHCMLGHVVEWYYGWVLGLRQAGGSVGWERALIAPEPGGLAWCGGEVLTPLGALRCSWRSEARRFTVTVEVPDGMAATVVLPVGCSGAVSVDGLRVTASRGLFGRLQVELGPGGHEVWAERR